MAFRGLESQIYSLRPLANDTFEWSLTLSQEAKRGRYRTWDPEFYKIHFVINGDAVDEI